MASRSRNGAPPPHVVFGMHLEPRHWGPVVDNLLMVQEAQPDPRLPRDRAALRSPGGPERGQPPPRGQLAVVLPPAILLQSPAGSITKDLRSRAWVAWPAQEWAPSGQSFLETALMP